MKRYVPLLFVAALLAACAAAAGPTATPQSTPTWLVPPTPTPPSSPTPTAAPSPGCEFTLLISNETESTVVVAVNTHAAATIESGHVQWLYAHQWPMPWDVVVSRFPDGVQLAARHYEDTHETEYMPVTDENIAMTASSCG